MDVGDQIKELRKARGVTQQRLAQEANVSISLVTQLEHGKDKNPQLSTLRGVSRALGVSISELVGE